ncbi:hypothetical protein ACSSS7_002390 [Eimeria intestinalis]
MEKEQKEWRQLQATKEQEAAAAAEAEASAEQRAFLETEAALTLETGASLKISQKPQTPEEFRFGGSGMRDCSRLHFVPAEAGAPATIVHYEGGGASEEFLDKDTETTRWLCALSRREILHQKAAVVKATGQVVLLEYLEKLVFGKKGALTSGVIDRKDVVPLVPGGTGSQQQQQQQKQQQHLQQKQQKQRQHLQQKQQNQQQHLQQK